MPEIGVFPDAKRLNDPASQRLNVIKLRGMMPA
jgi:hypothetical protein